MNLLSNPDPLWMIMPLGPSHGWGVCGRYLTLEMDRLTPVRLITEDLECEAHNDPSHYEALSRIQVRRGTLPRLAANGKCRLQGALLQCIEGHSLRPWLIQAAAERRIGYTFFERTNLRMEDLAAAQGYFDWIVAGSTWCERILRDHGLTSVNTIIQGVDLRKFHSGYGMKERYKDRFVVFSGGKLELRKGQDIVLRAFKVLQDRHDDVLLVNSWYNRWNDSVMTMKMSPYITFDMPGGDYFHAVRRLLAANRIDPEKVVTLPPIPHARMAEIYRDTDCALFPNRCEGGTNLVLMEYMACGKPAIVSSCTGHMDVIDGDNSIPLRAMGKLRIQDQKGEIAQVWDNPDIDEAIAGLEWAYQNPDTLKAIGRKAAESMQQHTWENTAKQFLELLQ